MRYCLTLPNCIVNNYHNYCNLLQIEEFANPNSLRVIKQKTKRKILVGVCKKNIFHLHNLCETSIIINFIYGIRGIANKWFSSHLCSRQQFVSIGNTNSNCLPIRHGVPQGSVLGPLLFLLFYLNKHHSCLKYSEATHYADDWQVYRIGPNLNLKVHSVYFKRGP